MTENDHSMRPYLTFTEEKTKRGGLKLIEIGNDRLDDFRRALRTNYGAYIMSATMRNKVELKSGIPEPDVLFPLVSDPGARPVRLLAVVDGDGEIVATGIGVWIREGNGQHFVPESIRGVIINFNALVKEYKKERILLGSGFSLDPEFAYDSPFKAALAMLLLVRFAADQIEPDSLGLMMFLDERVLEVFMGMNKIEIHESRIFPVPDGYSDFTGAIVLPSTRKP